MSFHTDNTPKRFHQEIPALLSTHPSVYPPHRFFSQRQGEDLYSFFEDLLLLNKTWYFEMGTPMQIQDNFNGKSSCFMKLQLCHCLLFSFLSQIYLNHSLCLWFLLLSPEAHWRALVLKWGQPRETSGPDLSLIDPLPRRRSSDLPVRFQNQGSTAA